MSIKEKAKELVAGVMLMTAVATTGCEDKKQTEVSQVKQAAPIVRTVEEEQKTEQERHEEICNSIVDIEELGDDDQWHKIEGLHPDYDKKTDTCHILDTNRYIEEELFDEWQWKGGSHKKIYDICHAYGFESILDGDRMKVECGSASDKTRVNGIITFKNVIPLCQDLAEQCKKDKDCKCGTKKDKYGCVKCEKQMRDTIIVNEELGGADELDAAAAASFNFHGQYVGNHLGMDGCCYSDASEDAKPCADDKSKYCVEDENITFKFYKVKFTTTEEMRKDCNNKCAKQDAKPIFNEYDGSCKCEKVITDEMYDNCKIKCVEQGSSPASKREEFDGNCKCKEPKESASLKQAQDKKLAMVQSMLYVNVH